MKNTHDIAPTPDEASVVPKSRHSIERLSIADAWRRTDADLLRRLEEANLRLEALPDPVQRRCEAKLDPSWMLYFEAEEEVYELAAALDELLFNALAAGELAATGRLGSPLADERAIPAAAWQYLRIFDSERSIAVENFEGGSKIFDVRISARADCEKRDETPKQSLAVVETKISDVQGCKRWLLQQMRATPHKRAFPKRQCFERARQQFPTLSERQFNRVWAEAVVETGASAWAAAGAPRKVATR